MTWILLVLVLLVAAGAFALFRARSGSSSRDSGEAPSGRRCVRCGGTGWLGQGPERTLDVEGDGFVDRHRPATMCPACGGTGHVSLK